MFCSNCGKQVRDGVRFCDNCGNALQDPQGVVYEAPVKPVRNSRNAVSSQDPYKQQIADLKLQIKQLKLYLKQITTKMSSTRSQYYETSAFVPHGLLHRGYKWFEDLRLLGPQQQKQQLQQQIIQLEQELLGLQQAQAQWKMQQGR
jgi:predicted amidophosphoribosyltransferase